MRHCRRQLHVDRPGDQPQRPLRRPTRGRTANHLAVVSDEGDLGAARNILEYVLTTDSADIPAIAVRRDLEQRGREIEEQDREPEPEPEPESIAPFADARLSLEEAQDRHDSAVDAARPYRTAVGKAVGYRDDVLEVCRAEILHQQLDDLQRRGPSRSGPELGLGR